MRWKVCNVTHERCPELTADPSGKCERHLAEARKASDAKRPNSAARGYDERWRKTRAAYLQRYPTCQDPSGCTEKATDVDHIDGLGPAGPQGHDWANLRGLCKAHHSKRTARDQPGGWNATPTSRRSGEPTDTGSTTDAAGFAVVPVRTT